MQKIILNALDFGCLHNNQPENNSDDVLSLSKTRIRKSLTDEWGVRGSEICRIDEISQDRSSGTMLSVY